MNNAIKKSHAYTETNNDPRSWENDLKQFREWFRKRENQQKEKFNYFYGPFNDDRQKVMNANEERKRLLKDRMSPSKCCGWAKAKAARDMQNFVDSQFDLKNYYLGYDSAGVKDDLGVFWSKLTSMITGADHEYVYLRRIISKMEDYHRAERKRYFAKKKLATNMFGMAMDQRFKRAVVERLNHPDGYKDDRPDGRRTMKSYMAHFSKTRSHKKSRSKSRERSSHHHTHRDHEHTEETHTFSVSHTNKSHARGHNTQSRRMETSNSKQESNQDIQLELANVIISQDSIAPATDAIATLQTNSVEEIERVRTVKVLKSTDKPAANNK